MNYWPDFTPEAAAALAEAELTYPRNPVFLSNGLPMRLVAFSNPERDDLRVRSLLDARPPTFNCRCVVPVDWTPQWVRKSGSEILEDITNQLADMEKHSRPESES